jgi:type IV pilus assembly protein PilO
MDLQSIDFNDPKIQKIILIILIGVALSGAIYYFQITPATEDLAVIISKRDKKQQELNEIRTIKPQLEKLRKSVKALEIELDSLSTVFPDSANLPSLISNLVKKARGVNVATLNFKPNADVKKQYYIEHSYEITILGGYHNIAKLLEHVANLDLIIKVDQMDIKVNPSLQKELDEYKSYDISDGYDDSIRTILVKFRITTYSSIPTDGK